MKKIIKASVLLLSLSTAFTMNAEPVNTMVLPDAARDKCYQRCKTDPPQRLKIDPGVNLLL